MTLLSPGRGGPGLARKGRCPGSLTRGKWGGCLTSWGHQGILCPGLSPLAAFRAPLWGGQAGGAGEGSGPGRAGRCEAGPEFGLGGAVETERCCGREWLVVTHSGVPAGTAAAVQGAGRGGATGPPAPGRVSSRIARVLAGRAPPRAPGSRVSWLLISAVMALQLLLAGARSSRQSSRLHVFLIKNCFSAQSFTMARFNDWHAVTNHRWPD